MLEINSQIDLSNVLNEEAVTELMLDAGYHNLSFKLKDIKSVVEMLSSIWQLENAGAVQSLLIKQTVYQIISGWSMYSVMVKV